MRPTTIRSFLGLGRLLGAFAVIALLFATPSKADKLTIGYLAASDFLPAFIAKEQGYFLAHGIDAQFQLIGNGATMPAAIASGSLDIGTPTAPGILLSAENGLDIVAIAGTDMTSPTYRFVDLVARPDLHAHVAKDFDHTTIGLPGLNGFAHFLLLRYLTGEGADIATIRFIETSFPAMSDLLRTRQVDAVTPVNPFLGRIVSAGTGVVVDGFGASIPDGTIAVVWAATADFVHTHKPQIAGFRAAIAEGIAWHTAHPEQDDTTLSHFLPLPVEVLKTIPKPPYTATVTAAQMKFWVDLLAAQKLVSPTLNPAARIAE